MDPIQPGLVKPLTLGSGHLVWGDNGQATGTRQKNQDHRKGIHRKSFAEHVANRVLKEASTIHPKETFFG